MKAVSSALSFIVFILSIHIVAKNVKFGSVNSRLLRKDKGDLDDILDKIQAATDIDLDNCDGDLCKNLIKLEFCPAMCSSNHTAFSKLVNTILACYKTQPCETNLGTWTLNDITFTIAVEGYKGQCYASGNQVIVSGGDKLLQETYNFVNITPSYEIEQSFNLTYTGLTVFCEPYALLTPDNQYFRGLLNFVLCLINFLAFTRWRLELGICGYVGSTSSAGQIQFQSRINVTQSMYLENMYLFEEQNFNVRISEIYGEATAVLPIDTRVPKDLMYKVELAVENYFENFRIIDLILYNYYSNFKNVWSSMYKSCLNDC